MTHLPECPAPLCDWGDPSAECMGYEDCHHLCCCDALRACEQRVLDAIDLPAANVQYQKVGYKIGYVAGLDAAREAVEALGPLVEVDKCAGGYDCCGCNTTYLLHKDSLAAIDALREEQK